MKVGFVCSLHNYETYDYYDMQLHLLKYRHTKRGITECPNCHYMIRFDNVGFIKENFDCPNCKEGIVEQ